MMEFIRAVVDAISDEEKTNGSSTAENPRTIIRKIEDIPAIHYGDKLTEIILNQELLKASIFLSGDFIIDYVDEKTYTCSYMLYFQDRSDETYKVAAKSKPLDITRLSEEARKDLETSKSIKFEVPAPTEEVRKGYKIVKR